MLPQIPKPPPAILLGAVSAVALLLGSAACDESGESDSSSSLTSNVSAAQISANAVRVETDLDFYIAWEPASVTITNPTADPIYIDSCTPLRSEERLDGEWGPGGFGEQRCIQAGVPIRIGPNELFEQQTVAPRDSGLYRFRIQPLKNCEEGRRLPLANCERLPDVFSEAVEVGRLLCDPSDPGCKFVPAQPNVLCADGINFSGPSDECTLDPSSGQCGYEILVCS